jgi:hypothetical protein
MWRCIYLYTFVLRMHSKWYRLVAVYSGHTKVELSFLSLTWEIDSLEFYCSAWISSSGNRFSIPSSWTMLFLIGLNATPLIVYLGCYYSKTMRSKRYFQFVIREFNSSKKRPKICTHFFLNGATIVTVQRSGLKGKCPRAEFFFFVSQTSQKISSEKQRMGI